MKINQKNKDKYTPPKIYDISVSLSQAMGSSKLPCTSGASNVTMDCTNGIGNTGSGVDCSNGNSNSAGGSFCTQGNQNLIGSCTNGNQNNGPMCSVGSGNTPI